MQVNIQGVERDLRRIEQIDSRLSRENEVREHIPVPYDNLFQSIFIFAPRCEKYI